MTENNDLGALDLKSLAIETLRQVCLDVGAPAQSRAAAARSIAEIVGLLGKNAEVISDTSGKDLSSMTAAELDAEIKRISKQSAKT
jgi:hypothetical protein